MPEVLKIEGGHRLKGKIKVSGSKNATVALIPAAILALEDAITIYGVPAIKDVASLMDLLAELNVEVIKKADGHLVIDTKAMKNTPLISDTVTKLRASYYFMGALLGKYKQVQIKMPGGCYLGPRPIDLHLKGFKELGAQIEYVKGDYHIKADKLIGADIFLDIASVGATINIMLAAVYAEGKTTIRNAAKEPEIVDVAVMLNKMGAQIKGAGTNEITIEGVKALTGCSHEIIPDRIEAGTYLIIAVAAAEEVIIENVIPHHIESLISKLREMNAYIEVEVDRVVVRNSVELIGVDVQTLPYPGFATDLQQPLTTLMTKASGKSIIKETIYAERFKHCGELQRMGAKIELGPAQATINGPTQLYGDSVTATDLRCGASLVVAGLIAEGVTEINEVFHIDRGYDDLDGKLRALGANIWREEK